MAAGVAAESDSLGRFLYSKGCCSCFAKAACSPEVWEGEAPLLDEEELEEGGLCDPSCLGLDMMGVRTLL